MMYLLSHPDRTLETHLSSCDSISKQLLEAKVMTDLFFEKSMLEEMRTILVYFHDFGKATDYFQHRIIVATEGENNQNKDFRKKHQPFLEWFKKEKKTKAAEELSFDYTLSRHSAIGAYFQFSNYSNEDEILEFITLQIIKCHHGNLPDYHRSVFLIDENGSSFFEKQLEKTDFNLYQNIINPFGFEISKSQWNSILTRFQDDVGVQRILRKLRKKKTYKYFFAQHFMFSFLLSADKGDVKVDNKDIIKANKCIPIETISNYKELVFGGKPKKAIDEIREKAYQDIAKNILKYSNESFFSITLPTGMGKTLSAYNASILLQNQLKETAYRIIYCLPFTSVIDQNEAIITEIFNKNGWDETQIAKNHYLARLKEKYGDDELTYQEAEYLTEGWEQEFIVTTFVQLLESIFTNKNKRIRKFHNMTNAIILLDEVQSISPKYYPLIETTFTKMAEYFNTKFIFITATQPIIFSDPAKVIELTDPTKVLTKGYFENLERIELDKTILAKGKIEIEDFCNILFEDVETNPEKSFLIICNTIKQSQDIYKFLNEKLDIEPYYLSSSILPTFRGKIIRAIQNNTKRRIRQIIVSTQVVEAGVDIDLDIVYRDLAPLDSINQSAGRCNRNGVNGTGKVKLFNSGKGKLLYDSTLLNITENIFKEYEDVILEKTFYELNNKYFSRVKEAVQDENPVSMELLEYMQTLQLKKLADGFNLIEQSDRNYNVFIPFDDTAKDFWQKYIDCHKIEDVYERKRAVKRLKPDLLQYVTRFPKYDYTPPEGQEDKSIIYLENWSDHYSLKFGYILEKDSKLTAFF